MRPFSPSPVFVAAAALVWGCTVYDSSLVPTDNSLVGSGDAPATSGSSNQSGSASTAGKTSMSSGGKADTGQAGTVSGGTAAFPEGGDGGDAPNVSSGSGGGGAGGTSSAGTGGVSTGGGGSGGTGGKASGGSGGTGGKGGSGGSGGTGGTGGTATVVKCADHPIPVKTTWAATASTFSLGNGMESDGLYNPPTHLTDGLAERWSSGKAQAGDEWIEIDFKVVVNITQLTLSVGNDTGDYPRMYAVRISNTSQDFAAAVKSSGAGALGNTVINWGSPITGRYLTVRQTGMDVPPETAWWTISEVSVACTE